MPLPIVDQLRLLHAWSPLLGYEKPASRFDDRLAARLSAVLRTPEGVELVRETVAIADTIADSLPEEPTS